MYSDKMESRMHRVSCLDLVESGDTPGEHGIVATKAADGLLVGLESGPHGKMAKRIEFLRENIEKIRVS